MAARTFDYIRQFWQENEAQVFSARETQLYFFLLAECNRQYWRNPFGCATQRITNNLDISRQTRQVASDVIVGGCVNRFPILYYIVYTFSLH